MSMSFDWTEIRKMKSIDLYEKFEYFWLVWTSTLTLTVHQSCGRVNSKIKEKNYKNSNFTNQKSNQKTAQKQKKIVRKKNSFFNS